MVVKESKYGQYKADIFNKLNFYFIKGKKMLDVGCGDCTDAEIFINEYGLDTYGIDVYEHENAKKILGQRFVKTEKGIFEIPFNKTTFDYVFLHDVLHHIDEESQSYGNHISGLKELKRVIRPNGVIIIVEGNRYNPLFYPHMVKHLGHEHFVQSYFHKIINNVFDNVEFKYFESHFYPPSQLKFWKIYEKFMETFAPRILLAYNVALITV